MPEVQKGRIAGKVALVSGAASGIGKATARLFARAGARVAVTDVDGEGAKRLAEEIRQSNGQTSWHKLDVTAEADWHAAIEETLKAWGQLDILVANAGISFAKPVAEMTLEEWRRVMAVNLDGVFLGTKHAVRAMCGGRGGSIVIVSSASGLRAGGGGASAYCASKAALRLFAKSVALECADDGIRVNVVLPGGVETPIWQSLANWKDLVEQHGSEEQVWKALGETQAGLKRFAKPEEIASALLFLASDESAFTTGAELVIDGGYTA